MKRIYHIICLWLLTTLVGWAQTVRLSDNPEQFVTDVQQLMATGGPGAVRAGQQLAQLWTDNALDTRQRERVMALSRSMSQKRYLPAAHFAPFYSALYHLLNTQQSPDLNGLLTVAEKQFAQNDAKAFARTLEAARLFLAGRLAYAGNVNRTYLQGGTFTFRYVDGTNGARPTTSDSTTSVANATTASRFDGWDDPAPTDSTLPKKLGPRYIPQRKPLPNVVGPVVTLTGASLIIQAAGDSAVLRNTNGDLLLREGVWVGNGGTFTWESVGRPDIYVTLTGYALNVATPKLAADDVTLTGATAQPTQGVFEYVAKKRVAGQPTTYPRFMSWQNDVSLPDLGSDLHYVGGLALSGTQRVGASVSGFPGTLTVKQPDGKPAFRVSSRRFDFPSPQLTAPATTSLADTSGFNTADLPPVERNPKAFIAAKTVSFTGYVGTDSITHPAVQFRYDRNQRVAWLNRIDRMTYGQVPYADHYHKFYVLPEVVRWDLNRQKVDFYQVGAKHEVPVWFESFDFFRPQRYADLALDYGFHPLQIVANYVSTKKTQTFLDDDVVAFARTGRGVNPNALRGALQRMVTEGFIDQAPDGTMRLSRKGVLYVLANAQKRDYDNFQVKSFFVSNDSVKNATIDLRNNLMTIRGVDRFTISDSLKVYGMPNNKTLYVGKGRAFSFDGQMTAGGSRYTGRDLKFDYDKFALNMNKIDSITFTTQKNGRPTQVGGDIRYDKPGTVILAGTNNKSGRMKDGKTTQRLVMPEGMTVYFDQPTRGSRVYNRNVYFKIPAIDNDSLGKGDVSFLGTFYSDGMLPPFKTELKTMPDGTLGFVHRAPAAGYALYGGKSTLKVAGELRMDKNGLQADAATLNHLTATLQAKDVLFTPDSVTTSGERGEIRESAGGKGGYFPRVELNNYTMAWWPKADSMVINTQKNNFTFYNNTTKLEGGLVLRSTGLYGNGTLTRPDAIAVSPSIKFNKDGFIADNSQFRITPNRQTDRPILLGTDVDVDFNLTKGLVNVAINPRKGQSIDDTLASAMEFPFAAYKTNINRAQWNINAKTIAMKAGSALGDVVTSTFTATAEEQEGLTFTGTAAVYDIEKMTLNVSGVPYVTAADARIFPDKGLVAVKRNGELMPFRNARLELDTTTLHHRLRNGNIQVLSRTRFAGDATYLLPTAAGDTAAIKMGSFELKEAPVTAQAPTDAKPARGRRKGSDKPLTTYYTVARAEVDERANLMLMPKMQFQGTITMEAPSPDLAIDGAVRPALKKRPGLVSGWIPFKEKIAEQFEIKVDEKLKNEDGQLLVAGIHARGDGSGLYPTFLSAKEDARDDDLFRATGVMRYDAESKVYRIIQKGPDGLDDVENAFTFDDDRGVMTFQGALGLVGPVPNNVATAGVPVAASGSARVNVDSSTYRLNTLLAFAFPIPEPVVLALADKVVKTNLEEQNDEAADDDLNRLSDKLTPLIGAKAVADYRAKAQNQHVSLAQAAPKLNAALVIADADLRYAPRTNSFYSIGTLGVSNMFGTDINAQMEGYLEIRKGGNGDEVSIYLEASPDMWVFYDYRATGAQTGQLAVVTSEQDINDRLTVAGRGKSGISLSGASADDKDQFVDRFLGQYKTREKRAPKPKAAPDDLVQKPAAPVTPNVVNAPATSPTNVATAPAPTATTSAAAGQVVTTSPNGVPKAPAAPSAASAKITTSAAGADKAAAKPNVVGGATPPGTGAPALAAPLPKALPDSVRTGAVAKPDTTKPGIKPAVDATVVKEEKKKAKEKKIEEEKEGF